MGDGEEMFQGELESFKHIDLRAYAAAQGYQLDAKESWRGSAVMRHPGGDKIIIKREASSGHYVYFSVRDNDDNGTIIDFVAQRNSLNLRIRGDWAKLGKELRPWIGAAPVPVPIFTPLAKTTKDRVLVETKYSRMQEATRHPYLEAERSLPSALLMSERFSGRIRVDVIAHVEYPNEIFPHFDERGLCGYEIKNRDFTGFASSGTKGLWLSHIRPDDNKIVFCESAIDALSYAVLFPHDRTRYGSIGGKPNPIQPGLIVESIVSMPRDSVIVAAMDADEDGRSLVGAVRQAFEFSARSDLLFEEHEPLGFKDWNDQLRGKQQPDLFPIVRTAGIHLG
jgi:hypothetical protein